MRIGFVFLVMVVGTIKPLYASEDISERQVKAWVEKGTILPFEEIYKMNRHRLEGRMLDLEVEREDGRIVYEVELLNQQGEVREIYLDAVTGRLIKEELED